MQGHNRLDIREPEVDGYHFGDRRRANMCAGSKADPGEGDQGGRAKGFQNNQQRQVKTRIYCEMAKLDDQMEQANETGDSKKFDQLFQRIYELGKKLGPEYTAWIEGRWIWRERDYFALSSS